MDETVVVTDAAVGLGAAIARAFGAEGATVVYGHPDAETVDSVTADIEDAAGTGIGLRTDARDQFDLERLMERAAREVGPIDVLIPAAIIDHDPNGEQTLPSISYSAFDDGIRTNLRGSFASIREAVPHFADDALILVPLPGGGNASDRSRPVSIAAAGVRGLVEVAAEDLDQSVVGVEFALPTDPDSDDELLNAVATAITTGFDSAARFDGRVVPVEELRDGP